MTFPQRQQPYFASEEWPLVAFVVPVAESHHYSRYQWQHWDYCSQHQRWHWLVSIVPELAAVLLRMLKLEPVPIELVAVESSSLLD